MAALLRKEFQISLLCSGPSSIYYLEVYPAGDGIVNLLHPVGREEHNPLVVLESAQENTDDGISMDTVV